MTACAGLTIYPAAVYADKYVEFILGSGNHQRLPYHENMLSLGEILGNIFAINGDFPRTFPYIYPRDRSLSAASSYTKILYHLT